jgi:hypothetical protein
MNRILLFSILLFVTCSFAIGQSLSISDINSNDVTGDTVYVNASVSETEIIEDFHVTNNSSNTLEVKAKKTEISLVSGSTNLFCWVLCFTPSTYVSTQFLSMSPGYTTSGGENLSVHYQPGGNVGTSIIAYTVFDKNNPNDSAIVYVVWDITTGIDDQNMASSYSTPYPNPANQYVNINYNTLTNSNVEFTLHNIVGKKVVNEQLSSQNGLYKLNTSSFSEGVYFYSIRENSKVVKTGKLTITH